MSVIHRRVVGFSRRGCPAAAAAPAVEKPAQGSPGGLAHRVDHRRWGAVDDRLWDRRGGHLLQFLDKAVNELPT